MPEAMIELDVGAPWEPPEAPPPPGRRAARRWAGLAVVLVAAGALLWAAAPRRDPWPLFGVDYQVLAVQAGGGRLMLLRNPPLAAARIGPLLQAVSARDGTPLWSRPVRTDESLALTTARVVLLQSSVVDDTGDASVLTALDARTGARLWQRPQAQALGLIAGRVLVEDRAGDGEPEGWDVSYGDPEDPAVNLPPLPGRERYLALEQDTGRVAWSVQTPPGTVPGLYWTRYGDYTAMTDLDAAGVLRVRDPGTGAVAATHRLDWSGSVARHQAGVAGQEIVYRGGGRGADVYDRGTGRLLWHWPGEGPAYNGLFPCQADRYCVYSTTGTEVLDPATGNLLWRAERYTNMLRSARGRILLYARDPDRPDDIAAFDAATGAVRWRLAGWTVLQDLAFGAGFGPDADRVLVWRPVSARDVVVAALDPDTGAVEVFGRATDLYGDVACAVDGDRLACLAPGNLFVWRMP